MSTCPKCFDDVGCTCEERQEIARLRKALAEARGVILRIAMFDTSQTCPTNNESAVLAAQDYIKLQENPARKERTHMSDNVNHPSHYQSSSGIECIDAIRAALGDAGAVDYCRGTVLKYAWRAGKKIDAAEDLRKAAWFANKAAEILEAQ